MKAVLPLAEQACNNLRNLDPRTTASLNSGAEIFQISDEIQLIENTWDSIKHSAVD